MWRVSRNEGSPSELQVNEPATEMYAPVRQLAPIELPAGEPEITEISNVREIGMRDRFGSQQKPYVLHFVRHLLEDYNFEKVISKLYLYHSM
jgi:hypothetical protein